MTHVTTDQFNFFVSGYDEGRSMSDAIWKKEYDAALARISRLEQYIDQLNAVTYDRSGRQGTQTKAKDMFR